MTLSWLAKENQLLPLLQGRLLSEFFKAFENVLASVYPNWVSPAEALSHKNLPGEKKKPTKYNRKDLMSIFNMPSPLNFLHHHPVLFEAGSEKNINSLGCSRHVLAAHVKYNTWWSVSKLKEKFPLPQLWARPAELALSPVVCSPTALSPLPVCGLVTFLQVLCILKSSSY